MIQTSTSTYYYKPKIDRAKRDKAAADLRDMRAQSNVWLDFGN